MSVDLVDELSGRLRSSVASGQSVSSIADLVRPCLAWLELLDDSLASEDWRSVDLATSRQRFLSRHLPHLQNALIRTVYKDWQNRTTRDEEYIFAALCPTAESVVACQVASTSRAVILTSDLWQHGSRESLHFLLLLLHQLSAHHLLFSMYRAVCATTDVPTSLPLWQASVGDILNTPVKVANAMGRRHWMSDVPESLERHIYNQKLSLDFQQLLDDLAGSRSRGAEVVLSSALGRMIRQGLFSSSPHGPSFWQAVLPGLLDRSGDSHPSSSEAWPATILLLPAHDMRAIASSLLSSLRGLYRDGIAELSREVTDLGPIKTAASVLTFVLGSLKTTEELEIWEAVQSTILGSGQRSTFMARIAVCWLALSSMGDVGKTLQLMNLIKAIIPIWSAPEFIARGDELEHRCARSLYACKPSSNIPDLTILLGLSICALPADRASLGEFANSRSFLGSIESHLSATRVGVRLRGMLLAEIISKMTSPDSPLCFGHEIWEGGGSVKEDIRSIRELISHTTDWKTVPVQPAALPDVMRNAQSPIATSTKKTSTKKTSKPVVTPQQGKALIQEVDRSIDVEDADELPAYAMPEENPSFKGDDDDILDVPLKKKPMAPVYIYELSSMLKKTEDADIQAVALGAAASLITRKAETRELVENANDLANALISLQDNFDLPLFEEQRLQALTLLVAACPQPVGPCLLEQLFGSQYSLQQRHAMLSAIGLAAASPAKLGEALSSLQLGEGDTLPKRKELPQRIRRLIQPVEASPGTGQIAAAPDKALISSRGPTPPETACNLNMTTGTPLKVADASILPLLNRFWIYLGDTTSVPGSHKGVSPYLGGAGTAIMLEPLMLAKFLSTLSILLDQSVLSPHFVDSIAPESLELVSALRASVESDGEATAAAFEAAMVLLQGLDRLSMVREFARSHEDLVQSMRDWARVTWRNARLSSAAQSRLGRATGGLLSALETVSGPEEFATWNIQTRL